MPMTELVENPWLNISWENSIADIDMEYLAKLSCFKKIQKNTLPEPYTGDVRSNVYCLNLNPSDACVCNDSEPQIKKRFEEYTQKNCAMKSITICGSGSKKRLAIRGGNKRQKSCVNIRKDRIQGCLS